MKNSQRTEAETLRRKGKSIKDIARILDVSPSTVSRWCKSIRLTSAQQSELDEKRKRAGLLALRPWIEKNRRLKIEDIRTQGRNGMRDVGKMTERDLLMLGLGLYWGEGYKRGSQEWGFTNSDPKVIRTILLWLKRCYGINPERIRALLTINALYKNESKRITHDWAKSTGIPLSSFAHPTFITGYGDSTKSGRTYRGTLRIKVSRGTSLRRRILASIEVVGNRS